MNLITERNDSVTRILNALFQKAMNEKLILNESDYKDSLDKLFSTSAWGFREILLVVIVARKYNPQFKASTNLYDCNPRAIYEGPIKEFLIKNNIPHRKSGPLNVAKATVGLNEEWAAQRRPSEVAKEVVRLVNYIEDENTQDVENRVDNVGVSLFRRLISQLHDIKMLSITVNPKADPNYLYNLCYKLITETPDSGNTPQKIAAYLLNNYHLFLHTGIVVTGEEDRASVTSTTSKKPGDINEENPEGVVRKVYEITVKHFDLSRIRDSYDCVSIYNNTKNLDIHEVIVICRKEDCPSDMISSGLHGYLGYYKYNDLVYYYWDIFEWIANTLQRMTDDGRVGFYLDLNSYIDDINTSISVKKLWKGLNEG